LLSNIVGQENIKKYLSNEIENDTLSYGYILEGDRFTGKSYIAQCAAEEITVPSYITVVSPTNDRKNIHVDDIRDMKNSAYSQSFGKAKKVYILPNADSLNTQSQNAFLKVLEEPPQDCIFFLLAENRCSLLSTIRSRCTLLKVGRYSTRNIQEYLETKEVECDLEIVRLCDGTLNKYLYLSSGEFAEVSSLSDRILLNIRQLHHARIFAIFKHIKKLDKMYVNDLLDLFLLWYRDMLVYKYTEDENLIEAVSKRTEIKQRINDYTIQEILVILKEIQFTKVKLAYNSNLEMTLNTLLLRMGGAITWET